MTRPARTPYLSLPTALLSRLEASGRNPEQVCDDVVRPVADGHRVQRGDVLLVVHGPTAQLLTARRTAQAVSRGN